MSTDTSSDKDLNREEELRRLIKRMSADDIAFMLRYGRGLLAIRTGTASAHEQAFVERVRLNMRAYRAEREASQPQRTSLPRSSANIGRRQFP